MSWRTHPQHHAGYLFLLRPAVVFAARVNQSTFAFTNPGLAQLTYDTVTTGAYTDIKPGQTVFIGSAAGKNDLGWQRIRKAATSTLIYFGASSRGDKRGEVNPADNAYITVLDWREVWAKIPRILLKSPYTIYKDYDLTASDYGTEPPPVANDIVNGRGSGWADFVDGTGYLTVTFEGNQSLITADGATLSTYLRDIQDGTIVSGTLSSGTLTAKFPPGFRYVSLTVTDSNGKSHTTYTPIFAAEPTGENAPIRDFIVERRRITVEGQQMDFRILEDIPAADYRDGTLVMYWEREWNGTAATTQTKFVGWHQTDEATIRREKTGLLRDTVLECADVAGRLATLPGFPQVIQHKVTPTKWTQMFVPDCDKYIHYLLYWHSTAFEVGAFNWSSNGDIYHFQVLGSDGQNLYDQADQRAKAMAHRLTCDSKGRLWVKADPLLLDRADAPFVYTAVQRTTTEQENLVGTDWSEMDFTHQPHPRIHWLRGEAVLVGAGTVDIRSVFCTAPGEVPGQGEGEQTQGQQLVTAQDELNAREGHRYARINAPETLFDVRLTHGNESGIEPALMEWVTLTLTTAQAAQRGLSFTEDRFLLTEIEVNYANEVTGRIKDQQIRLERETYGLPAQTFIPKTKNSPTYQPGSSLFPKTTWTPPSGPGSFQLNKGTGNMAVITSSRHICRTSDFTTPSASGGPTWDAVSMASSITGTVMDYVVDPWSPLYVGTGSTVNGWIVTTYGIYRITDFFGTPSASLQHTLDVTLTDTFNQHAQIDFGWGQQNWGVCVIFYRNASGHVGTWTTYTTNGSTWATEQQITAHYHPSETTLQPGLFCSSRDPGLAYISAPTSSTPSTLYGVPTALFRTTDHGANWSEVITPSDFDPKDYSSGGILAPWDDNLDQSIVYFGGYGSTSPAGARLYRKNRDGTVDNVSPGGGYICAPYHRWGIQACPINRQRMILQGGNGPLTIYPVFVSQNGGDTWTQVTGITDLDNYYRVFVAGNDGNTLYIWGEHFYYSTDFGVTVDDKLGNMSTVIGSAPYIVGIMGG